MNTKFDYLIKEAVKMKCCKLCCHSYLRDDIEFGYCKKLENAYGNMPKIVHEMDKCQYWEKKKK